MLATKPKFLKIDGNTGEGGGQIIRTALALSMLTGTPIEVTNIRAGRSRPGLMRQHLMCLQASQQISGAKVTGDALGSTAFTFIPNDIVADDYTFDIGSAGSVNLVLQTILPALLFANAKLTSSSSSSQPSTLIIRGGTHNPFAPTADFLQHGFVPILAKLGINIEYELIQSGYAPVGGGEVKVTIDPYRRRATNLPLNLTHRGELLGIDLVASHLNLEGDICQRELKCAKKKLVNLGVDESLITSRVKKQKGIGEGNCCYAIVTHSINSKNNNPRSNSDNNSDGQAQPDGPKTHQEVFTLLGEKRTSAENVGNRFAGLIKRYLLKTEAVVDEYLTDQLLLPLALSGGGQFTARTISSHTKTQAWMIEQFLPVSILLKQIDEHNYLVKVVG